jgi:hypothetical protein
MGSRPALPDTTQSVKGRRFYTQWRAVGSIPVKIAARRHFQIEIPGQVFQLRDLIRRLVAAEHLNTAAPCRHEIGHQTPQFHPRKAILQWMGDYGCSAGCHNPPCYLGQFRPERFYIPRLALPQILVKGLVEILHMTLPDHPGGKVRTTQLAGAGLLRSTLQGPRETPGRQSTGNQGAPLLPGRIHVCQCSAHGRMFTIDTKPQNMNRSTRPLAGQLYARDEPHTARMLPMISCSGLVTGHRIVVGYGQQIDLAGQRSRHQLAGIKSAVRSTGVRMEVNQHKLYTVQRCRELNRIV